MTPQVAAFGRIVDTFDLANVSATVEPLPAESASRSGRILMIWRGPILMRSFGEALPNDGAFVIDRRGDLISRLAWFRDAGEARAAAVA